MRVGEGLAVKDVVGPSTAVEERMGEVKATVGSSTEGKRSENDRVATEKKKELQIEEEVRMV